jgi:hypothetical protein
MNKFSSDWLALREPADAAARSSRLAQLIARVLAGIDPLRIVDLAAGTGANVRYLAEYLPSRQEWLVVDHDRDLLDRAITMMPPSIAREGGRIDAKEIDLRTIADAATSVVFAGRALVTASALLDLVSDAWLQALIAQCRDEGAAVLFALSYDGRMHCTPEEPEDDLVRDLVNRHQQTDKGFGPALGPHAAATAEKYFMAAGYLVHREQTDWILSPDDSALQRPLVDGWAQAACEMVPDETNHIQSWRARRIGHLDSGRSRIIVGHYDLAAWQ